MPYKSMAQERFFHSEGAPKAGITKQQINEFDEKSKGMHLMKAAQAPKGPQMQSPWMGLRTTKNAAGNV